MNRNVVTIAAIGTVGAAALGVGLQRGLEALSVPRVPTAELPLLAEASFQNSAHAQEVGLANTEAARAAPEAAPRGVWFTVRSGDSLSEIAELAYGSAERWTEIQNAPQNIEFITGRNRDVVKAGDTLWIPGVSALPSQPSQRESSSALPFSQSVLRKVYPWGDPSTVSVNAAFVSHALQNKGITSRRMIAYAFATIAAESTEFLPATELPSSLNTRRNGLTFSAYVGILGNRDLTDAQNYRGRGFIQLTGRWNYQKYDTLLGLGGALVRNPQLAAEPQLAARIFAAYIAENRVAIERALNRNDLRDARAVVNGGTHGFERFEQSYRQLFDGFEKSTNIAKR